MPINPAHKKLLNDLVKKHASNAIMKRQVNRAIVAGKNIYNQQAQSGAITRQMGRLGGLINPAVGMGAQAIGRVITGHGDYNLGRGIKSARHERSHRHGAITRGEKGEMIISHSEYVSDLVSGGSGTVTAFTSQAYGINAGNAALFPWLSTIANQFANFTFEKLVVEFRPLTSEATSTTSGSLQSMGSVMIGCEYDASKGLFPNKSQLLNSDFAVDSKPSEKAMMAVECAHRYNPLGVYYTNAESNYQNTGASNSAPTVVSATNYDIRMQNMGILQLASVNVPIATNTAISLGEIFVHYKVKLFKPLIGNFTSTLSAHYDTITAPATSGPFSNSGAASAQALNQRPGSLLNMTFFGNGVIYFPSSVTQGTYLIVYYISGDQAAVASTGFINPVNCSLLTLWVNDGATYAFAPNALAGTAPTSNTMMLSCIVTINAPGASVASIQLVTSVVPLNGNADILITPWNQNITT